MRREMPAAIGLWLMVVPFVLVGALAILMPLPFAMRSTEMTQNPVANIPLIRGMGFAFIAAGLALWFEREDSKDTIWKASLCVALLTLAAMIAYAFRLENWWIDDAGITFSYSRSLAEGLGIRAQPWLPPEEGYSSSAWMLLLAVFARLGADIPLTAKALGVGFSAASMLICTGLVARFTRSPVAALACGLGIAVTPTVVWSASGQEHALQGLLLTLMVLCVFAMANWRWPVAVLLSVYVLTRPEGPMIVIAVFLTGIWLTRQSNGRLFNTADAALALLPFLTFVGLMVFRVTYFGDVFPNPYYAKSSEAGFIGLINPLSGGWFYLLSGLRDSGVLWILPLIFLVRGRPPWMVIGFSIVAAHVVFVVWAKGDWMGQYRFLMPVLPVAVMLATCGVSQLGGPGVRQIFGACAALLLVHTTTIQVATFATRPTTPMAAVTEVGNGFRNLADRLQIEDPLLAHHDAGGIAFHRMVRLADLGGLVNRTIGMHMDDSDFLTTYLVEDLRPDFVFGARNFAASSGFAETPAFAKAYVPLIFADNPGMVAEISFIRRDQVKEADGVTLEKDADSHLVSVTVTALN